MDQNPTFEMTVEQRAEKIRQVFLAKMPEEKSFISMLSPFSKRMSDDYNIVDWSQWEQWSQWPQMR